MIKHAKIVIIGDSAFAEVAYEYFTWDSNYEVAGFSVEESYMTRSRLNNLPVVAFEEIEKYFNPQEHHAFAAITYGKLNRIRSRLANEAKKKGFKLGSFISSKINVYSNVNVGEHCFIFENNVLQPFVKIGNNVILWSGNHIGHHSVVEDNVFISSHCILSGYSRIGANSFIGVNSTISNNVTVGRDNWIGPSCLISSDTPSNSIFQIEQSPVSRVPAKRFFKVQDDQ